MLLRLFLLVWFTIDETIRVYAADGAQVVLRGQFLEILQYWQGLPQFWLRRACELQGLGGFRRQQV